MASDALSDTARIARDLIRFDTTNWGGGRANPETEAANYVEAELARLGLEPRMFDSAPGRTSVVAKVEGANPQRPALIVHGHLDVVPADPTNWSVDPFAGEVRDGMLWGRGAVDMKDMDAMILTAVGELLEAGRLPARPLVLAFMADEEDSGVYGSQWLVREHPELFAGATEAISEVGGYSIEVGGRRSYLLQTGEKALLWIRLVATGPAAHGSRLVGRNAVTRLAEAVAALGRHEWPVRFTATTSALIAEVERLSGVKAKEVGPDAVLMETGTAAGFLLGTLRTTSNPTVLDAGYKHNVIPDRAEALVDIRTLPGEEDAVLATVRDLVGDDIEIEIVQRDIGLETPFEGQLVERMRAAIELHDPGAPVLPYLLSGGTDNKAFARLGVTGYGFAPLRLGPELDFPGMFHGVDERVPLDAIDFGHRVLVDLLRDC